MRGARIRAAGDRPLRACGGPHVHPVPRRQYAYRRQAKVVFGRYDTVNCYLDVEIGAASIVADWAYITDFDHAFDDITVPIKDQAS